MHKSVLENSLDNLRPSLRLRHQDHVLRLHVSRELGIWRGRDVAGLEAVRTADFQRRRVNFPYNHTGVLQLGDHALEMVWTAVFDLELSLCQTSGHDERSSLNPI